MSNCKNVRGKWIELARLVANDKEVQVKYPECNHAYLEVRDILIDDSDMFERMIYCKSYGVQNYMRINLKAQMILSILDKAEKLFTETNLKVEQLDAGRVFSYKGGYYRFTFVKGLEAFVLEYAESLEEAQKYRYEDSELYPLVLGDGGILDKLRNDIGNYILKTD